MFNKFWSKLVFMMLVVGTLPTASAANIETGVGQDQSLFRCAESGGLEFDGFLDAVMWSDNFFEGVVEPWIDVIFRNQCHALDVRALIRHQKSIREEVRNAHLTCNTEDAASMTKRHRDITAEIYYVRHIVDAEVVFATPSKKLANPAFQQFLIKNRDTMYREMSERYVNADFLSKEEFADLFLKLESKYKDRITSYVLCGDNPWNQVEDKFIEVEEYLAETFAEAGDRLDAKADDVGKTIEDSQLVEFLTTDESVEDYMSGFVNINIDAEGIGETFNDLIDGIGASNDYAAPEDLLSAYAKSGRKHEINSMRARMKANYRVLYGEASDETVKLFMESIDGDGGLNEILVETFPHVKNLTDSAEKINDKQCSG